MSDTLEEGWVECDWCFAETGVANTDEQLREHIRLWNLFSTVVAKEKKKKQKPLNPKEVDQLLLELEC